MFRKRFTERTTSGSSSSMMSESHQPNKIASKLLLSLLVLCTPYMLCIMVLEYQFHHFDITSQSRMNSTSLLRSRYYSSSSSSAAAAAAAATTTAGDSSEENMSNSMDDLRLRFPPSIWSVAGRRTTTRSRSSSSSSSSSAEEDSYSNQVKSLLTEQEYTRGQDLCAQFLWSTLHKAVHVYHGGDQVFVATGDIHDMWTRDGSVQMSLYLGRMTTPTPTPTTNHPIASLDPNNSTNNNANHNHSHRHIHVPWLRSVVEGSIRRHAFNIVQDPYANAYASTWIDPQSLPERDRVIGRGGWVATRNYEVDSGAYFLNFLYDYYVVPDLYRPDVLLRETLVFEAVQALVDVYMIEQHHDTQSSYRYFELPNEGLGTPTAYTGMTWSGFRPSDDPNVYGYSIPSNIHLASALERMLEVNKRVWQSKVLGRKMSQLLSDITSGIQQFGVVKSNLSGDYVYAYEVDGMGNVLSEFDDANVPSLLSIPILGWTGYDVQVYRNTRALLLNATTNRQFYSGRAFSGIGSPHTAPRYVWPMTFAVHALTEPEPESRLSSVAHKATIMAYEIRQSIQSACHDHMHESVHIDSADGCIYTRDWFEWSNALFVTLWETATGERCDRDAHDWILSAQPPSPSTIKGLRYYSDPYQNNPRERRYYQGIAAQIPYT